MTKIQALFTHCPRAELTENQIKKITGVSWTLRAQLSIEERRGFLVSRLAGVHVRVYRRKGWQGD